MAEPLGAPASTTKVVSEWQEPGKGPKNDLEARVAYGMINAPATALWTTGITLSEFRVSVVKDGYRVILKGRKGGKRLIAFVHAETWRQAIRTAVTELDSEHVPWQRDTWTYTP